MTVLFVHEALVRDGPWWWHRMVEPLARRGLSLTIGMLGSRFTTGSDDRRRN